MPCEFPYITENHVDDGCRNPSADDIHGIVRLDVNGGEAHQHEEGQYAIEEFLVLGAPGEEEQDCTDAYMTAGEGGRGAFAGIVGGHHALVEESVAIAGDGQALTVRGEKVVHVGEHSVGDVIHTCGQIVVLWSCDGQRDEDDVVDEERSEYDKGRATEFFITVKEIEQGHQGDQWIVRGIAQVHQLAEHRIGEVLREEQGRLAVEKLLLIACEEMVEVGEHPVELIGVGIPPGKQGHLGNDAAEVGEPAGQHPVDSPHGNGHRHDTYAPPEHRLRVDHFRVGEKHDQQGECQIAEDDPFDGQQSFLRLLLNLE